MQTCLSYKGRGKGGKNVQRNWKENEKEGQINKTLYESKCKGATTSEKEVERKRKEIRKMCKPASLIKEEEREWKKCKKMEWKIKEKIVILKKVQRKRQQAKWKGSKKKVKGCENKLEVEMKVERNRTGSRKKLKERW